MVFFRSKKLQNILPIHDLANDLDSDLVEVLLAIHPLTGWDTANKVGTKTRAGKECSWLLPLTVRIW